MSFPRKVLAVLAICCVSPYGADAQPRQPEPSRNRNSAQREEIRKQLAARRQQLQQAQQARAQTALRNRQLAASRRPAPMTTSPLAQAKPAATPAPEVREPAFRELLESLSPEERQVGLQYVRGLDEESRRELREMMVAMPAEERKGKFLEYAKSGRKPDRLADLKQKVGLAPEPEVKPLSIAALQPRDQQFSPAALNAAGATLPRPGSPAPRALLQALNGPAIDLSAPRTKPLVVEFGSLTCPLYRGKIPAMTQLQQKYGQRADFLMVYTLEAHPQGVPSPYSNKEWVPQKNLKDGVTKRQPTHAAERTAFAKEAVAIYGERLPVAVDSMDNAAWRAYGARPNSAVVIGTDGRIAAAQEWTDPEQLEKVLSDLTRPPGTQSAHATP